MAGQPRPPRETGRLSFGRELLGRAKGLGATLSEALKPSLTVQYPEDKSPRAERYRGRHYLRRYDNGLERCISCEHFAAACPVGCILVLASVNTPKQRVSPGRP